VYTYPAMLVRVIDGDTCEVLIDLGFHVSLRAVLRLAGIDAPELPTPEGKRAAQRLRELLGKHELRISTHKSPEKYGRFLAEIEAGGLAVNGQLIAEGLAKPYDGGKRLPPEKPAP
jgi:micrococcal nuclease